MGGAFFNLLATKFAFYEGVAAVAKVEDQVGFQAVTVVIVRQFTAEVLGVGSEVPCAHVFEDEAEGLQLGLQGLGSGSEGGNGDGRVCEFSLEAATDSSLVADGRAPGFQVIDDKELVERAHVVVKVSMVVDFFARVEIFLDQARRIIRAVRPVPLCLIIFLSTMVEPVRM